MFTWVNRRVLWSHVLWTLECIALLCLVTLPCLPASTGRYSFRVYENPDGLEDLVIRDILQDREGFLWVATHTGLYRFDGRLFRRFTTVDGLADNWVTHLAEDASGQLWVSTNRGLCRRVGNAFETVVPARSWLRFRPNMGTPLTTDTEGNVYLGSEHGLFAIRKAPRAGDPPMAPPVYVEKLADLAAFRGGLGALLVEDQAWIWFTDSRQRLVRRQLQTGVTEEVDPGLPEDIWLSVVRDRRGTVWIAGAQGQLFARERGQAQFHRTGVAYSGQGRMAELRSGAIAVPAASGFWLVRPSHAGAPGLDVELVDAGAGLPGELVECFLEDQDGFLWIGTVGTGLIRWTGGSAWRSWQLQDGMSGEFVTQIVQDPSRVRWVGTLRGLLQVSGPRDELRRVQLPARWGMDAPIYALASSTDGHLWLSTTRGSIQRYDPRTGQGWSYGAREGFEFAEVCHIVVRNQEVWIADVGGLSVLRQGSSGLRQERVWPLAGDHAQVYRIAFAPDGTLWAATGRGVLQWRDGKTRLFGKAEGLLADDVFGIALAPDGALWLHYRLPLGVTRATPREESLDLRHFREADGLASNKVFSVAADASKRIWVGTESGLSVLAGAPPWTTFNRDHGLVWNDCNFGAILVDTQGSVWTGTSKGLSRFRPPGRVERAPPRVVIHQLRGDGERLLPGAAITEFASNAELTVSYAALRFANQAALRFRYRLDGGPQWIETPDREVNFAALGPGLHRFEVAASEGGNKWSGQPAAVSFRIPTPWWQQWWARGMGVWLVLALIRAVWRWRYHRMIRHQTQLETAVGERTRELEVQREKAEAASKFKDQILANVSHEIRTPLNGIVGFTSLVLDSNLDAEQREQLRTVHASGKSLVDIIEDLLDFASIEAGELQIHERAIQLEEVVDQTIRTLRFEADRRGLLFHSHLAEDLPSGVLGDDHRLRQVLLNLTGNAIKFTEQGSVSLWVSRRADPPEWAGSPAAAGSLPAVASNPAQDSSAAASAAERVWILFEVADTGIGISPEHLEQIFEPFRQLDGSSRRVHGGTGLGLAMVRRIIEQMGGAIHVDSEVGRGSTFRVALPMGVAAAPVVACLPEAAPLGAASPDASAPPEAPAIRRVLIAEDNPVNQKLLDRILAKKGLEVVAVADGKEAVETARRESFDLILMDIQMPVMDGIEATRRIRELECSLGARRIPIIAVTANGMFQCREECASVGMDGYVVKPFGPANLFAAIDTVQRRVNGNAATDSPGSPTVSPGEDRCTGTGAPHRNSA